MPKKVPRPYSAFTIYSARAAPPGAVITREAACATRDRKPGGQAPSSTAVPPCASFDVCASPIVDLPCARLASRGCVNESILEGLLVCKVPVDDHVVGSVVRVAVWGQNLREVLVLDVSVYGAEISGGGLGELRGPVPQALSALGCIGDGKQEQ